MERGRLRVYLGAAPGVGKTFAMLDEAQRRHERGTDVVVGLIETHGRPNTIKAIGDLEILPRRTIHYKNSVHEEMDLDAIIARKPEVVLVDELAHTNIPGSLNEKRWQDVELIRDAGIEVITTVNIQHLESLNDVAESITGIRQRETVPDAVVRGADQIELVDMSPQSLRRRMAHGNVYGADKVDAALSNYFREGNLTALRELALLWLADRVDEGLDRYRDQHDIKGTWATRERIVAAVTGGKDSLTLMRRAARIASRRAGGKWMALYVTRQDGLSGISAERLADIRAKAEALGGTFHTTMGDDPAEAILDFAHAENADQIIIGTSRRSRLSTVLRPGIGERVVADAGDIDVHIVTHDDARSQTLRPAAPQAKLSKQRKLWGFGFAFVAPVSVGLLMKQVSSLHETMPESMALLAVVVITALIGGLFPAIVAALLSGTLLNLLFTTPLHTLAISDPGNAVAILIFVVMGISVALVVDRSARRTSDARKARAQANALTVLSHSLLNSGHDLNGLLNSACDMFSAQGAAVIQLDDTGPNTVLAQTGDAPLSLEGADISTELDETTFLVLKGGNQGASERGLLNAYAAYAKVMAERQQAIGAEIERARLFEVDRTRTALLAAVSHDLRSPLAAVKASVSSLRDPAVSFSKEDEDALLETIEDSSDRLNLLVTNLLDMSRIATQAVSVNITEVNVLLAIERAIAPLGSRERFLVNVDQDMIALADPGLFDRVLANICENSVKYTPADTPIRIDAALTPDLTVIRVADTGPGVNDHDRERLFAPFQRLGDVPQGDGVGLGLAVAHGLTEAMGGKISSEDTPGGGLTFVLELPRYQEVS